MPPLPASFFGADYQLEEQQASGGIQAAQVMGDFGSLQQAQAAESSAAAATALRESSAAAALGENSAAAASDDKFARLVGGFEALRDLFATQGGCPLGEIPVPGLHDAGTTSRYDRFKM